MLLSYISTNYTYCITYEGENLPKSTQLPVPPADSRLEYGRRRNANPLPEGWPHWTVWTNISDHIRGNIINI